MNSIDTAYSLCNIYYDMDVTDQYWQTEKEWCFDQFTAYDVKLTDLAMAILDSPHEEAARSRWGETFTAAVGLNSMLVSEDILDLQSREQKLSNSYDEIFATTTVIYNGKEYTMEALSADESLSYDEYMDVYNQLMPILNAALGPVYMELVDVRCEIASTLGFDSYAEYMYICYGRDYTPQDAAEYHQVVKDYIVPTFVDIVLAYIMEWDSTALDSAEFDMAASYDAISNDLSSFDPEMAKIFDRMVDYGYIDMNPGENRSRSQYTTFIFDYDMPFNLLL